LRIWAVSKDFEGAWVCQIHTSHIQSCFIALLGDVINFGRTACFRSYSWIVAESVQLLKLVFVFTGIRTLGISWLTSCVWI
jgi:hypothetical protein